MTLLKSCIEVESWSAFSIINLPSNTLSRKEKWLGKNFHISHLLVSMNTFDSMTGQFKHNSKNSVIRMLCFACIVVWHKARENTSYNRDGDMILLPPLTNPLWHQAMHYGTQVTHLLFFDCKIGDFKIAGRVCLQKSLFTFSLTRYFLVIFLIMHWKLTRCMAVHVLHCLLASF